MKELLKVLLIEDDPVTSTLVKSSLGPLIQVETYEKGSRALDDIDHINPHLIILDLVLPDMHGLNILKDIRSLLSFKNTPIIILTSSESLQDEVIGHESGVTEYLRKPLKPQVLKAVVEKNLAQVIGSKSETLSFENISVDLLSMSASVDSKPIDLTQKELKILIYLMENKERVLSKEQIFNKIWKDDSSSLLRTVEMHMSSLRKKLGPAATHIQTLRGLGYSLKKN